MRRIDLFLSPDVKLQNCHDGALLSLSEVCREMVGVSVFLRMR